MITVIDGVNSYLQGDVDGDRVADFQVKVLNHHVGFDDLFFTAFYPDPAPDFGIFR